MNQTYSTPTLDFSPGEDPTWEFELFQDDANTQPFLLNGYTLSGAIGFPFGGVRYLELSPTELFLSGPNKITLSLSSSQTLALPIGGQTLRDPPNLCLSIWGRLTKKIPLIRSQMRNLPMVPTNG